MRKALAIALASLAVVFPVQAADEAEIKEEQLFRGITSFYVKKEFAIEIIYACARDTDEIPDALRRTGHVVLEPGELMNISTITNELGNEIRYAGRIDNFIIFRCYETNPDGSLDFDKAEYFAVPASAVMVTVGLVDLKE